MEGFSLPASWEAERKPRQIGAFCLLPLMHHSRYEMILCSHSALSSLWNSRKEVQTELRGRLVRRSAGKTKQNKNSSREWAGRSQSRNRALGFRGAPVPWQTKQRSTVWFWFLLQTHIHGHPLLVFCFYVWVVSSTTPLVPPSFQPETHSKRVYTLITHNLLVIALPQGVL